MSSPRGSPNANIVNGKLYVIDGDLIIMNDTIQPLTRGPSKRLCQLRDTGVTSIDDKIYSIGGPNPGLQCKWDGLGIRRTICIVDFTCYLLMIISTSINS
jgi:hypothetical protein